MMSPSIRFIRRKETGEYDERNKLDIQRLLHQEIKVKSGEMFDVCQGLGEFRTSSNTRKMI